MTFVSHRVCWEHRRCERRKDEGGRTTADTATCGQVLRQTSKSSYIYIMNYEPRNYRPILELSSVLHSSMSKHSPAPGVQ